MKPYHRLSFVAPVLILAGTFYSIWAYRERGIPGLRISAEGWLIALIAAVLLNLLLWRFRDNAGHGSGREVMGWTVAVAGAVIGGYAFGLVKGVIGIALTAAAALMIFFAILSAARQKKPTGE